MRLPFLLTTLAVVTALIATACGSDEEAEDSGTESAVGQTVEVAAKDFSFTPGKLQGETDRAFEVAFRNSGSVPHTFTIDEFNVDVEAVAGEETSVSITPSGAGEFTYYCRFHRAQGMQGRITVTGEGGAVAPSPGSPTPAGASDDGYRGY